MELEQRERDIADLARAGHQLAAMVEEQEHSLEELDGHLSGEREALHRERAALGGLMRSAYAIGAGGTGDHIRILLMQEDPNRLSRALAYHGYLNRYRIGRIEGIVQRTRRLDELIQQAREDKERLGSLAYEQEATRARLTAAQEERSALVASLGRTIETGSERIADLRRQAEEMRLVLKRLERQARILPEAELRQEPLRLQRGRLTWPLADAPMVSRFGSPKGDGAQRWDGVVLKAREGTAVRAVYHGRVAYADWLRGFGLLLIIEHDDDYMSLYGYNQTLLREPGEWVAPGDILALSGNSGGRLSPGLYFAIRHRGRPVDPERWCRHRHGTARGGS